MFLMRKNKNIIKLLLIAVLLAATPVSAFQAGGCGAGDCRDCHAVNRQEVAELLKGTVNDVLDVRPSKVPGLWDVEAVYQGKKVPLYLDFSKKYLISGNVVELDNKVNLTQRSFVSMNKTDQSRIPLDDAVVIGNPAAANRIIVFDDPECMFCRKLQPEIEKVVAFQSDIAFFVKMYPLASHPDAKDKAKAIICAKLQGNNARAAALLADSLAGKPLPAPDCVSDRVEKNIALAKELYIGSTPTLVMPDGRIIPGFKEADKIVEDMRAAGP